MNAGDKPQGSMAGAPHALGATRRRRPNRASYSAAAVAAAAALAAASCCIIPIGLILTGVAGAGLMVSVMRYEWLTLPLGVLGLGGAWWLYWRQARRCRTNACAFVGRRLNLALLVGGTLVVAVALLLRLMPAMTAGILQHTHP